MIPGVASAEGRRDGPTSVLVSAHRGGAGNDRDRENTLEAIEEAVRAGVDFVEVDVRLDDDGRPIISHDRPRAGPSTLDSALDRIAGHAGVHLDLKIVDGALDAVAETVRRLGVPAIVVTTAEDALVSELRDWAATHAPGLRVGLSTSARADDGRRRSRWLVSAAAWFPRTRMRRCGADVVVAHRTLARWWLRSWARRRGLPLLVWTVDDPAELAFWMNDPHTWMVTTNHPLRAMTARR